MIKLFKKLWQNLLRLKGYESHMDESRRKVNQQNLFIGHLFDFIYISINLVAKFSLVKAANLATFAIMALISYHMPYCFIPCFSQASTIVLSSVKLITNGLITGLISNFASYLRTWDKSYLHLPSFGQVVNNGFLNYFIFLPAISLIHFNNSKEIILNYGAKLFSYLKLYTQLTIIFSTIIELAPFVTKMTNSCLAFLGVKNYLEQKIAPNFYDAANKLSSYQNELTIVATALTGYYFSNSKDFIGKIKDSANYFTELLQSGVLFTFGTKFIVNFADSIAHIISTTYKNPANLGREVTAKSVSLAEKITRPVKSDHFIKNLLSTAMGASRSYIEQSTPDLSISMPTPSTKMLWVNSIKACTLLGRHPLKGLISLNDGKASTNIISSP